MTSPDQPSNLRESLITVVAAAVADLDPLWRIPKPELTQALFDVVPGVVQKWNLASASVAADWYDTLREQHAVSGRFTAVIPDLRDQGGQALAGWGAESLKRPSPDLSPSEMPVTQLDPVEETRYRIEGGLQKRLVNAANLTITKSAVEDPQARGWMRKTRPNACDFCLLVASRGAVYTKATVTFACHEHCFCVGVPAWGGEELPVQPYRPSARQSTATDRARVKQWIRDNITSAS